LFYPHLSFYMRSIQISSACQLCRFTVTNIVGRRGRDALPELEVGHGRVEGCPRWHPHLFPKLWALEIWSSARFCQGPMLENFFPLSQTTRPNKLECLYLAITFQFSLTFAGSTRCLPKKEASERHCNWVGSGLAVKFKT